MKKLLSCFIFLLVSIAMQAQWIQQSSPTNANLHSVFFTDSLNGYVGGQTCILKTTNGGTTWNLLDFTGPDSTRMDFGFYIGLHFFNGSAGVAVGKSFLDNGSFIIRTADGGTNWNTVHLALNNGIQLNAATFSGSNDGFAVGTNGMILHSTDGGNSWFPQASGTNADLNDVFFTSATTGYAVGDTIILKTTNGGVSWSSTPTPYYLTGVWFTGPNTGFATTAANGLLLKTTDAGNSWTMSNTYVSADFEDICFTDAMTGYICGAGVILKTLDGGAVWEQQIFAPGTAVLRAIDFPTFHSGYSVGYTGSAVIEKTGNAGGALTPVASFSAPALVCADSTIYFTSNGPTGYQYQWLDNGLPFGSSYTVSRTFSAATTHTITLIVTHNSLSDTSAEVINVAGSLALNLQTNVSSDSICAGASVTVQVLNSDPAAVYQLRDGTTVLGSPLNGTGGTVNFPSGPINGTTTLNLQATKTNACGGTNEVIVYHLITVFPMPNTSLIVTAMDTGICYGDSSQIRVDNSTAGFTYRLRIGTTTIGFPQAGNGGSLYFPTGALTGSATYNIYATGITGCSAQLAQQATIVVQQAVASFQASQQQVIAGDSLSFTNTSNTSVFSWDFGNGASPATSTLQNPGNVMFGVTGANTVTLIGQTSFGCADTASLTVDIIQAAPSLPQSAVYCDSIIFTPDNYWDHLNNVYIDARGNKYITDAYINYTTSTRIYMKLNKYSPQGNLLWTQNHGTTNSQFRSVVPAAVTVDKFGNVYMGGTFGADPLQFDNVSTGQIYDSDVANGWLAKFDSLGNAQWIVHTNNTSTSSYTTLTDVEVDNEGCIYASFVRTAPTANFHFPDGSVIQFTGGDDIIVFKLRPDGSVIRYFRGGNPTGPFSSNYGPVHWGFFSVNENSPDRTSSYCTAPQLNLLNCGGVMLTGIVVNTSATNDKYVFGSDTLHFSQGKKSGYFVLLDSLAGWQSAHSIYSITPLLQTQQMHYAEADAAGNVYMIAEAFNYSNTIDSILIGNNLLYYQSGISVLMKYNSGGNLLWYALFENTHLRDLTVDADGGVVVSGEFQKICAITCPQGTFGIQGAGAYSPTVQYYDYVIMKFSPTGQLYWTDNKQSVDIEKAYYSDASTCGQIYFAMKHQDPFGGPENIKIYHLSPSGNCQSGNLVASFSSSTAGPTVTFSNTSPGATSWNWDFGDNSTATTPTPVHTYAVTGNYNVTLTVSDGNCSNSVCYPVSPYTILSQFTASVTTICAGDTVAFTNQSLLASAYQWQVNGTPVDTATDISYVFMTPGTHTVSLIAYGNGTDTSYVTIAVNPLPVVTLSLADTVCLSDGAFSMTAVASPAGGVFSGTGVSGSQFIPSSVSPGTYPVTYTYTATTGCVNFAADAVVVDACVYVAEAGSENSFDLFPNPASDAVAVQFTGAADYKDLFVELMDIQGRLLKRQVIGASEKTEIKREGIADGLYLVRLVSGTTVLASGRIVFGR